MDSKAAAAYIITFNNLYRPQMLPGNFLNHWYFDIRSIHRENEDIIQISHLETRRSHYVDPAPIFSTPTIEAMVTRAVILVIQAFVKGLSLTLPDGELQRDLGFFAPSTWSTANWDVARVAGVVLHNLGVRSDLCTVRLASKTELDEADGAWSSPCVRFQLASFRRRFEIKARCGKCNRDPSSITSQLYRCGCCHKVSYCSRNCQDDDWEEHESVCYKDGFADLVALNYYQNIADSVKKTRELIEWLDLTIPKGQNDTVSLIVPIRRLVITGRDIPKNLERLLGPPWRSFEEHMWDARIDILLRPPPGSLSYFLNVENDEQAHAFTPQPTTQADKEMVEKVREMQTRIARQIGVRKKPDTHDMDQVLLSFGDKCLDMIRIYRLAVTTMDIGLPNPKQNPNTISSTWCDDEGTRWIIPSIKYFIPSFYTITPGKQFPCKLRSTFSFPRFIHKSKACEFLVYIDGVCLKEGTPDAAAGWGFIFRDSEPGYPQIGTRSGRVEEQGPTSTYYPLTRQRAQLRAVVAVLQCPNWSLDGWTSLVIATHSAYVFNGVTEGVHIWIKNGWKTAMGTDVQNQDLWQQLLRDVVRHHQKKLEICFWMIPQSSNRNAESAAEEGATKDPGEFFDDAIGRTC